MNAVEKALLRCFARLNPLRVTVTMVDLAFNCPLDTLCNERAIDGGLPLAIADPMFNDDFAFALLRLNCR